jgi:septum formation protein
MRLILASASPRRAELLAAAGFAFDVLAVDVDERVRAGERPDVYVRRLAKEKSARALEALVAAAVASGSAAEDVCVLGADTSVVIDGEILGKPRESEDSEDSEGTAGGGMDARSMLRRLSGRRHEVLTGVSLRWGSVAVRFDPDAASRPELELSRVERTAVFFAPLGDAEVDWYVQSGEGRDKAGGYAIQGLASRFVPRIEGSYSNVVGLPVAVVDELLREIARRRSI